MSGLMLHAGAQPVDYDTLRAIPVPPATETHVPIAHHSVVEMVKYSLGFFGHDVVAEHYGVTPDGMRFFGLLELQSQYGDYTDTVGLRNSSDKRFPIGISFGSRVFVCDNLAFAGEHVIKRKHTKNAKHALPSLVAQIVEPLREQRLLQARTFERYQQTPLTLAQADHIAMQLHRRDVLNFNRVKDVLEAYEHPPHDWGGETAWRLFNATTYALTGRVMENPSAIQPVYEIIDGFCEPVDHNQLALPQL